MRADPEIAAQTPRTEGRAEQRDPVQVARKLRSFMLIWVAQLVARVGNGLSAFGLAVFVYQQTGLSTWVAAVTMAAILPSVLLAPLGGVLADRFDRRLLMICGDTFSAVALIALVVAFHTGVANVLLICVCVAIGSVFGSVMDPAYRATVTDLLTPEQYARAGGLVQLASASQYLISPALAGLLMMRFDISVVLLIDVSTMVVTTLCMVAVWRTIRTRPARPQTSVLEDLRFGVAFLARSPGIATLMWLVTLATFCMGFLQTLLTAMLLDLSDEQALGLVRSGAAVGMVVASLVIGVFGMTARHLRVMAIALASGGVVVALMGATTNVLLIGAFAFAFFMTLPPLSTSVEVLARASIPNETQGRVWGLIGFISQVGYIVAYAVSGPLADWLFNPLLVSGGPLAGSVGNVIGVGASRGIGLMLLVVGILLIGLACLLPRVRSVRAIDRAVREKLAAEAAK